MGSLPSPGTRALSEAQWAWAVSWRSWGITVMEGQEAAVMLWSPSLGTIEAGEL